MRPCENVIVTVQLEQETLDMELPAFLPVRELTQKLEETFRIMKPSYQAFRHAVLSCNGRDLDPTMNLAQHGIWDGSILACRFIKEETI